MSIDDLFKRPLSSWLASMKAGELQEAEKRKTPAMRQHEYAVARKSILGQFSSQPISLSQECMRDEKAARRKQRLDLVNRALVACPEHGKQAARLRQDMDEVENMRCAKHVYLANDPNAPVDLRDNPPPGFLKATPEQVEAMGLDEKTLAPRGSNFKAAVYIKDTAVWGPNPKPGAILAFRGSTTADEDWKNNFAQDANAESSYYDRAVKIGNALAKNHADVQLVGHSLGGGLASAAQGGSGLNASTYNAAGLHPLTVARYSEDRNHIAAEPEKITAIRVKGEILTKTQESVFGSGGLSILANDAVGKKRDISACLDEEQFENLKKDRQVDEKEKYDTYLHGMDQVIDSTEAEKAADETELKGCISRRGECV